MPAKIEHSKAFRALVWVVSLLKTGIALAIIIIIAVHLNNQTIWVANGTGQWVEVEWTCLLGWGTDRAASLCIYGYIVAGWSLVLSAILSLLVVASCGVFGWILVCEYTMSLFGFVWWVVAAAVLTEHAQRGDSFGMPNNKWRHSVCVMSWVMTIIYVLLHYAYTQAWHAVRREAAATAANKGGQQMVGVMVAAPVVVMMPNKAEDGTMLIAHAT